MSTISLPEFLLTRDFAVSRERLWETFTQAEHMKQWWGHAGSTVIASEMDFRPGGSYLYGLRNEDGSEMWGKCDYLEIEKPEFVTFLNGFCDPQGNRVRHPLSDTWPLNMHTTYRFSPLGDDKSRLDIRWVPQNANEVEIKTFGDNLEACRMGWKGTLDKFEAYLTTL